MESILDAGRLMEICKENKFIPLLVFTLKAI